MYGKDGFEIIGKFDVDSIPYEKPLQVRDYPIVEDQSHESEESYEFGESYELEDNLELESLELEEEEEEQHKDEL